MSAGRRRHSRAVAGWARALARAYGADPERAFQAGLLHDLAKEWSDNKLLKYIREHRLRTPGLDELRRRGLVGLLHGHVSAHRARERGWARDRAALNAMARHTLGHPRMTLIDKILFVADFSSSDRRYAEAVAVRRAARRDLDRAVRLVAAAKIAEVVRRGRYLHPSMVKLWNAMAGEGKAEGGDRRER
jgi:predicted HD superfamily hydrolase involved in NAD metabolism